MGRAKLATSVRVAVELANDTNSAQNVVETASYSRSLGTVL
jgi:hypothetical protein